MNKKREVKSNKKDFNNQRYLNNFNNKRAVAFVMVGIILGLVVIGAMVPVIKFMVKSGDPDLSDIISPDSGFEPWVYENKLSHDEILADASMTALKKAIDYISGDTTSIELDSTKIKETNIKNYEVIYYITFEFDDQLWEFDYKKQLTSKKITDLTVSPIDIWTHVYDSVNDIEEEFSNSYDEVKHIKTVHNIELVVDYKDGTNCLEKTYEGNNKYLGDDLAAWGGKDDEGNFRDGFDENDEPDRGCVDSASFLQCPGIKVSYCGKKGSKNFEGNSKERTFSQKISDSLNIEDKKLKSNYWDRNGKSTSMVKTRIEIDNRITNKISKKETGVSAGLYEQFAHVGNYKRTRAYCDGGQKIMGTDVTVKCEDGGTICHVCDFYLPQEVTDAENWITGYGDPQYLAYYESFPVGMDEYWKFSTVKTAALIGGTAIAVGSINYLTSRIGLKFSKTEIKQIIKTGSKEFAKIYGKEGAEWIVRDATNEAIEAMVKKAGKDGVKSVVKSGMFRNSLEEISGVGVGYSKYFGDAYETFLKESADEFTHSTFKSSTKIIKEIEEEALGKFYNNLDDMLANPTNYGKSQGFFNGLSKTGKPRGEAKELLKSGIISNAKKTFSSRVSDLDIEEFLIKRSTIMAFKNLASKKGANEFSEVAVKEAIEQADEIIKVVDDFSPEFKKQLFDGANKRVFSLFNKKGILDKSAIEFFDVNIDNLNDKLSDSTLKKIANSWKAVYGTTKEGLKVVPNGWVGGPWFPLAGGGSKWTLGLSMNPVKHVDKSLRFLYGKRYTMLFSVALLAEYQDRVNDKLAPGGVNSLLLGSPSAMGEKKVEYTLSEKALKYYVALHERYKSRDIFGESVETTRFYLASPCKTDLVIKEQTCNCMRNPDNFQYNFGGGPMGVKKGTIFANPGITKKQSNEVMDILLSNQYLEDSPLNSKTFLEDNHAIINNIDTSRAVKVCESRGIFGDLKNLFGDDTRELYTTQCISVEPLVHQGDLDSNYCYPRFPKTEEFKSFISQTVLVGSVIAEILTGGLATPVVVVVGMGEAVVTGMITEELQKWPRSEGERG